MKTYRNTKEMVRKESLGRRFSLVGLGILFIGMMASFVPNWYPPGAETPNQVAAFLQQYWALASFIALPAGFLCASIGSYFINRFARRRWPGSKGAARPDEVLERNMKGFDDKYAYFVHSLPATYLVAGPCGVLLFALRSDRTQVTIQGDRWREKFGIGRFFTVFAREGLGNPPRDLEDQRSKIRALLDSATSQTEDGTPVSLKEVPIDSAAVFLNDDTKLEVDGPNIPVLRADQVKEYVRRRTREVKLSNQAIRALHEALLAKSTHQG
ncbi:MAG: hypothetical protein KF832_05950 [Caldilineaceae bacterium]|nr:hypothetical protein [Caldilineaceae bacterium]